jgi:alpha-ketoglutarate-dependent taurine dioxygenase
MHRKPQVGERSNRCDIDERSGMHQTTEIYEVASPTDDSQVRAKLGHYGLAIVRDITRDRFEKIFDSIASRRTHRDSTADGVTEIRALFEGEPGNGYAGFTRMPMPPHSDGSAQENPPELLSLWCANAGQSGGDALLVDIVPVLETLAAQLPTTVAVLAEAVVELGKPVPYRCTLLKTTSVGRWAFRFRDDGLADYSMLGEHVHHLRNAIAAATLHVTLAQGDAYFLNNGRWLHGREGFEGTRSMMRILGDYRTTVWDEGLQAGFEAATGLSTLAAAS